MKTKRPLARNQGACAAGPRPPHCPAYRAGRSSRKSSTGGFLIAHHPPGRALLQRQSPELRWEGWHHKAPTSTVGAPARGRARPCGVRGSRAGARPTGCAVVGAGAPHPHPLPTRGKGGAGWLVAGEWCAMNAHPTGVGASPDLRVAGWHPPYAGWVALAYRIFWPVFAQSALNWSRPLSVSTWLARALMTFGGAVTTSAPIRAQSLTWLAVRMDAARIWVLKS